MKNEIIKAGQTYPMGNFNLKVMYIAGRHAYVEKTTMFQQEPIKALQLASIIDGKIILNLNNESEQHKRSTEELKAIVDGWAMDDENTIRNEAEAVVRQKEAERLEMIRGQKVSDAKEQRIADVTEVKKLITEAKDFKAVRKNARISELLSEIAEIDTLLTLI